MRSMSDFVNAAVGLVVSNGLAAATGQPPSFQAPTVLANSELEVVARFSLAPAQILRVMRQLAEQSVGELRAGRAPTFTIPYNLEGTILVRRRLVRPRRDPRAPPPAPGPSDSDPLSPLCGERVRVRGRQG